jgi:hypothetical protein
MWSYLVSGGYAMWGVVLSGIVMVVMIVRGALRPVDRGNLDAILLWAGAALGIGVIGTLVGISQVASAMAAAQSASGGWVAWAGVRLALSTSIVGSVLFVMGLAGWALLRTISPNPAGEAAARSS